MFFVVCTCQAVLVFAKCPGTHSHLGARVEELGTQVWALGCRVQRCWGNPRAPRT